MKHGMRILVCGDRHWKNYRVILHVLSEVTRPYVLPLVIDGAAPGADSLGHKAARFLGCPTKRFPADWSTYGKAAGPIRNSQMLREGKPHLVLAFHNDLKNSKGTKDMVTKAKKAGVPVRIFREKKTRQNLPLSEFLNNPPKGLFAMIVSKATFYFLVTALQAAGIQKKIADLAKKENWPKGAIRVCESHEIPIGLMAAVAKNGQILGTYNVPLTTEGEEKIH
jgi:hypothetical protein